MRDPGVGAVHGIPSEKISTRDLLAITENDAVVVDFTGRIATWTPTAGILIPHCSLYQVCVALPGVVRALCGHPTAIPTPAVLAAAARAIATFTAPGRTLPDPDTPGLPEAVARAVTAVLDR
ncbi:hypothetical protein ACWEVD_16190 [Nocardia thailandica]